MGQKRQHYCGTDPDWATHFEWVINEPKRRVTEHYEFGVVTENPVLFLLAIVSTPQDGVPRSVDTTIELGDLSTGVPLVSKDHQHVFPGKPSRLQIVDKPIDGAWRITATHGRHPFAVSAMAFHPAKTSLTAPPSTKCRVCRHTSKALALAIVAAGGAVATPALIAAVGTFLSAAGATAAAAAAAGAATASGGITATAIATFIGSMAGDPAGVVAQKLCNYIRLCP